jgi:hypothetical protein
LRGVCDRLRRSGGMIFEDLCEQLVENIAHSIRVFRCRRIGTRGSEPGGKP